MKIQKPIAILLLGSFMLVNTGYAQNLPSSPGPISGTNSFSLPTVPISNPAYEAKETGINILGLKLPFSWDSLAIMTAKHFIERMVDSTVEWIKTGRDGGPTYVTDPEQYFSNIADGVAGEFIKSSNLNFLCSPFQANIRLSLVQNYYPTQPFQCTLTDVVGNIENFYGDFNQGGWNAWFSMTQNPTNNPYGAYLAAKIELDSRVAKKLGIEEGELNRNNGYLGIKKCLEKDSVGECIKYGETLTPGTVLQQQLEQSIGSPMRQLELADEFDELIGAALGALVNKTILSASGLFKTNYKVASTPRSGTDNSTEPSTPSCSAPLPLPTGSAPNMLGTVQAVAQEFPDLFARSAYTFEFLDKVVERLHAEDSNWGYNGKRGDANNLSSDAIAYMATGDARSVHIIDIIGNQGAANATPAWTDVTADTYNCGTVGVYVYPRSTSSPDNPADPAPLQ